MAGSASAAVSTRCSPKPPGRCCSSASTTLAAGAELIGRTGVAVELDGRLLRVAMPATGAAQITRLLAESGLYVNELRPEAVTLEDLFLDVTRTDAHAEEVAA